MNNIYLFVGPSGVGKTTIMDALAAQYGYSILESYTDRPRRFAGEKGRTFLSPVEFDALRDVFAYTEFDGHRYGITSAMLDDADLYNVDIPGVRDIQSGYTGKKGIVVFGLTEDTVVLRARMMARGDSAEQAVERVVHDAKAFRDLHDVSTHYIKASDLVATIDFIKEAIDFHERQPIKE